MSQWTNGNLKAASTRMVEQSHDEPGKGAGVFRSEKIADYGQLNQSIVHSAERTDYEHTNRLKLIEIAMTDLRRKKQ